MLLVTTTILNTYGVTHILDANLVNSQVSAIRTVLNVGYIRALCESGFGFGHERRWYCVAEKEV
jgi:hypothetical protein